MGLHEPLLLLRPEDAALGRGWPRIALPVAEADRITNNPIWAVCAVAFADAIALLSEDLRVSFLPEVFEKERDRVRERYGVKIQNLHFSSSVRFRDRGGKLNKKPSGLLVAPARKCFRKTTLL